MASQFNVGVVGHSYIRRLGQFVGENQCYDNLCLDKLTFKIYFKGRGGLTVRGLAASKHLSEFPHSLDLCFVQIGGNDVGSRDAYDIARDIVAYACYLKDGCGVRYVVIGQLLRRRPRNSTPGFNEEVMKINRHLVNLTSQLPDVRFWKHRGFWGDLSFLGRDGVHLDVRQRGSAPSPMVKYMKSIKYAIYNVFKGQ